MKRFLGTHRHIWWALYFVVYLIGFFLVEAVVPTEGYHVMYHPLDDLIPFCEYFIVFYYIWYLFLAGTALFLIFYDGPAFRRYMWFLILGFSFTLIFNVVYPNGQDLRPDLSALGRENLFTTLIGMIYSADTNTNVCPSMHVIGCAALTSRPRRCLSSSIRSSTFFGESLSRPLYTASYTDCFAEKRISLKNGTKKP